MKQNVSPVVVGIVIAVVVIVVGFFGWKSTAKSKSAGPAPADMQTQMAAHGMNGNRMAPPSTGGGSMRPGGMSGSPTPVH